MKINKMLCPSGLKTNPNRPLKSIDFITIHCTGNYSTTATAESHAKLQYSGNGDKQASWHYSVDKDEIWQSYEDTQECWHAGDGSNGPGNYTSIGIEICVNDKNGFAAACYNAACLAAELLIKHGLSVDKVVQHNKWAAKNCPAELRSGAWGVTWDGFIAIVFENIITMTSSQPERNNTIRFDFFGQKVIDIDGTNLDGIIHVKARELLEAMDFLVVWNDMSKTVYVRLKTMFPITNEELIILEKITEAEAGGEDDTGKLLVANVVLNRIKSAVFPDNIKDVVFQDKPSVQFTPTVNSIFEKAVPSQATKKAVQQALCGEDHSQGALFFCSVASAANPKSYHELEREFLFQHGGHRFYK